MATYFGAGPHVPSFFTDNMSTREYRSALRPPSTTSPNPQSDSSTTENGATGSHRNEVKYRPPQTTTRWQRPQFREHLQPRLGAHRIRTSRHTASRHGPRKSTGSRPNLIGSRSPGFPSWRNAFQQRSPMSLAPTETTTTMIVSAPSAPTTLPSLSSTNLTRMSSEADAPGYTTMGT